MRLSDVALYMQPLDIIDVRILNLNRYHLSDLRGSCDLTLFWFFADRK